MDLVVDLVVGLAVVSKDKEDHKVEGAVVIIDIHPSLHKEAQ